MQSLDGRSIRVDEAGKGLRRTGTGQYPGRGGGGRFSGGSRGRGELNHFKEKTSVELNSWMCL